MYIPFRYYSIIRLIAINKKISSYFPKHFYLMLKVLIIALYFFLQGKSFVCSKIGGYPKLLGFYVVSETGILQYPSNQLRNEGLIALHF